MFKKSTNHEVWFHVINGKIVGLLARVPELLRLDLISIEEDFELSDLNKWLYLTESGLCREYNTREEAVVDLAEVKVI